MTEEEKKRTKMEVDVVIAPRHARSDGKLCRNSGQPLSQIAGHLHQMSLVAEVFTTEEYKALYQL